VVNTRVREADLHKIAPGAPVSVAVDAYPDLHLAASVDLVGALAEEDPARAGAKFFPVTVRLTQQDSRLRTGMTARADIQVAAIDRALVVPIQALIDRPDGSVAVNVVTDGRVTMRPVTLRARNSDMAAIATGLRSGDVVELIDPAGAPANDR